MDRRISSVSLEHIPVYAVMLFVWTVDYPTCDPFLSKTLILLRKKSKKEIACDEIDRWKHRRRVRNGSNANSGMCARIIEVKWTAEARKKKKKMAKNHSLESFDVMTNGMSFLVWVFSSSPTAFRNQMTRFRGTQANKIDEFTHLRLINCIYLMTWFGKSSEIMENPQ